MDDYNNENRIIDPKRNDFPATDHTQDWIKVATAAILLISAIAAIFNSYTDDDEWRD